MALCACLRTICRQQGNATYALYPLSKPQFAIRIQHVSRTLPSDFPQKLTSIHSFHSSAALKVPRGLRLSSALKKSNLPDAPVTSEDGGLDGTYLVGRTSSLTSKYDGGQVDMYDERNEHLFSDDKDLLYDERVYDNIVKKKASRTDTPFRGKGDSSIEQDYDDTAKIRGPRTYSFDQDYDDEMVERTSRALPDTLTSRKGNSPSEGTQNSKQKWTKHQQRRDEEWVDESWVGQSTDDGKNVAKTMYAPSEPRITVPKMSNAFPFPRPVGVLNDDRPQRASRKQTVDLKEEGARTDVQKRGRKWVDESWFSGEANEGDRSGNMDENREPRTSSPPKSSRGMDYEDSGDLLEVDEEWTSQNKLKEKIERRETRKTERQKQNENRSILQDVTAAGNEILFGIAPSLIALRTAKRVIHRAFISSSFQESKRNEVQSILAALKGHVDVKVVHRNELDRLCGQRPHQGVCLETSPLEVFTLSDRQDVLDAQLESFHQQQQGQQYHPVWLALDQVKDPMNFGAVLRSSYFLGVDRVITCVKNSCPLSPVVSKASSGVMELLDVYSAHDMPLFLQSMSSLGWQVIGACSSTFANANDDDIETVPCHQFTPTKPTVLVIGNEGYGLRSKVRTACSKFLTIEPGRELHPGIDSLNVSVATGILLHSILGMRK